LLDRKIALISVGFFAAFYAATFRYPPETVSFPRFLLWIFLVLSVILFIFPKKHPDYSFKAILPKEKVTAALLLIGYTVIFPKLGFFVTTFCFSIIYMWAFNKKDLKKYVMIAAVYILIVYFVFQKWLYVWFPEGLLM